MMTHRVVLSNLRLGQRICFRTTGNYKYDCKITKNCSAKLQLLKAAILPYLTFCHLIWHFHRPSDTRKLLNEFRKGVCVLFLETITRAGRITNSTGKTTTRHLITYVQSQARPVSAKYLWFIYSWLFSLQSTKDWIHFTQIELCYLWARGYSL